MNNTAVRLVVAIVLLFFAWKGSELSIVWPPAPVAPDAKVEPSAPMPDPAVLEWAEPLRGILPTMLPADRTYLSSLYDAMSFVLLRDGQREQPIVATTEQFAAFHANSLRLSIDRSKVGQYPGLDKAIDLVFVNANGAEVKPITDDSRAKLIAACQVISYALGIRRDE
jgi:hypothetical protein